MQFRFQLLPGAYVVAKLTGSVPAFPMEVKPSALFSLTLTDDEISLVCEESEVPASAVCASIQRDWRVLKIEGILDFSLVGILARITGVLSSKGISIFALSTHNTDYILVQSKSLPAAMSALKADGHAIFGQNSDM
ncbi:hypothetical protein M2447_002068 [Ereboglobus sp. PH5-10]|uniref:ACT domain-containing protein n=1 Tax=Ereboglobus sp. PH5-10 TaxID=2940629 RepID=UPI0024069EA3|nr:ACT domain-containing protein [Ereboglobus sp. PH5-10]MDF9827963.1 hypothetical protein [Ereboglobus sp. PH5-10]